MGEYDRQIVMELKQRLSTEVSRHLKKVILYGSRARGDAAADSDLDLIALLDEKTPELERLLDDAAYNVMWDHDFNPIISIKVFEEARFRSAAQKGFSFYRNIEREGIEL
jgi:predicted nucleotidyltransferase